MKYIQTRSDGTWEVRTDSSNTIPPGCLQITDEQYLQLLVGVLTFNGTDVVPMPAPQPEAPVIPAMTPRQIRLILNATGLRSQVEAMVAQSSQDVKDTWEFSTMIERSNPMLIAMAGQLGLTDQQIDDLFINGAKL